MNAPHPFPSISFRGGKAVRPSTRHRRMVTCVLGVACLASSAIDAGAASKTTRAPAKGKAKTVAPTTQGASKPTSPTTNPTAPVTSTTVAAVASQIPKKGGTLRLGYFPNVTHAPAIAGVEAGFFAKALGPDVKLQTSAIGAGAAAIEALLSGAIASQQTQRAFSATWARGGKRADRATKGVKCRPA